jgi:hypothetical protein
MTEIIVAVRKVLCKRTWKLAFLLKFYRKLAFEFIAWSLPQRLEHSVDIFRKCIRNAVPTATIRNSYCY